MYAFIQQMGRTKDSELMIDLHWVRAFMVLMHLGLTALCAP